MNIKPKQILLLAASAVLYISLVFSIYLIVTKNAETGSHDLAKMKIKKIEADKYDTEVKKDMATMYEAQKKYLELKGRYFQCGHFKGDDNCDGFDDNYPFKTMIPVLNNVPFSEMDKIYGIEQRNQWEYKGIDNTDNGQQFCYYAKLMNGGYYTASPKGNFERADRPWSFEECASSQNIPSPEKTAIWQKETAERDNERMADMRQVWNVQEECYADDAIYCQMKKFPGGTESVNIGKGGWRSFPTDPLDTGDECGKDYIYCVIDNTNAPHDFCYYAKLEKSGFYVMTPKGGFIKETAPSTLADCKSERFKHLTLLYPVGDEALEAGKTYRIKWSSDFVDNVWISATKWSPEMATNHWMRIPWEKMNPGPQAGIPATAGYYDWTIAKDFAPAGGQQAYKLSITDHWESDSATGDQSEEFIIKGPSAN